MPAEVILFPNAQAVIANFLRDELAVRVERQVPNPRPSQFVIVRRTGGVRGSIVHDEPILAVECFDDDDADAHDLAQLVRAYLHTLPGTQVDGVTIYGVDELSGPSDLPDPLSSQSRYTQTFVVRMRGDDGINGS